MSKTPCHDAFRAAQAQRTKHPLRSGAYKLREAQWAISRMQETMYAIGEYLKKRDIYYPGAALGPCCTTDDK
jgi:hypothetical protein